MRQSRCSLLASVAGGLMVIPSALLALGLGDIELKSSLNQPLNAEIVLLGLDDLSWEQIQIKMADRKTYDAAELQWPDALNGIEFKWNHDPSEPRVLLHTPHVIKEPYLEFLVEMAWPTGRVVREYTMLLDPRLTTPLDESEPTGEVFAQAMESSEAAVKPEPDPIYGPVQTGERLWDIAKAWRRDSSISTSQAMMAIFDKNPNAFQNQNINMLMKGAMLQIPSESEMRERKQVTASQEVAAHHRARWDGSQRPLVPINPTTLVAEQHSGTPEDNAGPSVIAASQIDASADAPDLQVALTGQHQHTADALDRALYQHEEALALEGQLRSSLETLEERLMLKDQEIQELQHKNAELHQQVLSLQASQPVAVKMEGSAPDDTVERALWLTWVPILAAGVVASMAGLYLYMQRRWHRLAGFEQADALEVDGATLSNASDHDILSQMNLEDKMGSGVDGMEVHEQSSCAPEVDKQETEILAKLDLAAAYIDMGDVENARTILHEVLKEGNPDQRLQAQRLLDAAKTSD